MRTIYVIICAILIGACISCDSKNNNAVPVNSRPTITAATWDGATASLTVTVNDQNGDDVTVTVTEPAGLSVDETTKTAAGGTGSVVFVWTADDGALGAQGDTTITVTDGITTSPMTQTATIVIAGTNTAPTTGVITVTDLADGRADLSIVVNDAQDEELTVTVTAPANMSVEDATTTVDNLPGQAQFRFVAADPATGATGDTTITVTDPHNATATAVQTVTIAAIAAPVFITTTAVTDAGDGTATLTVSVAHPTNQNIAVGLELPAGMEAESSLLIVPNGNGDAVFHLSAVDPAAGASGIVRITATDDVQTDHYLQSTTIAAVVGHMPPSIDNVVWDDLNDGTGTLSVTVSDPENNAVAVSVSAITGASVDASTVNLTTGNGTAVFTFTEDTAGAGAAGDVTITADNTFKQDTAVAAISLAHTIVIDPPEFADDTLYAFPSAIQANVGESVLVYVVTGQPAHYLSFLNSVGFTVETGATYAANSFNSGVPGGARMDGDGYWGLLGPPPPTSAQFLDLGDAFMPGTPVDIGGGLHRYTFAIVTMGAFAPPAAGIAGGAVLFNFWLTFNEAGVYHLGFQRDAPNGDLTDPITYYSDWTPGGQYYWGTLDSSYSITVTAP